MQPVIDHPWNISESEAISLQKDLASQVTSTDQFESIELIAGIDVAYSKASKTLVAAVVVLNAVSGKLVETVTIQDQEQFPYIPGLFSFRELPPIVKAFEKLSCTPQLVVCDGQGLAHPRRFGLACHLGVIFDIATIGCGKTRLVGEEIEPDSERGSFTYLVDKENIIGATLRTQTGIKPIYVSIGHRISLTTACDWVLKLASKYRLPETTRQADQVVRKVIKGLESSPKPEGADNK